MQRSGCGGGQDPVSLLKTSGAFWKLLDFGAKMCKVHARSHEQAVRVGTGSRSSLVQGWSILGLPWSEATCTPKSPPPLLCHLVTLLPSPKHAVSTDDFVIFP